MGHRQFHLVPALVLAVSLALPVVHAQAEMVRYEILPGSEVVFESKAPMEKFKGTTKDVSGWFEADLANIGGLMDLEVRVELASFDTGKKKRNEHMRENHLETDKYPQAVFRGGGAGSARLEEGKTTVTLEGELELHGVIQEVTYEITLDFRTDGTVAVETDFIVKLSDHNIDRPRFLVMKLADEQKVRVRLKTRPKSGEDGND